LTITQVKRTKTSSEVGIPTVNMERLNHSQLPRQVYRSI
jgi:hypothetical protein